ncbi:MAG: hypothetical protein P4L53_09355 [Candidatus Obscuribacterales bacterium]|nr:hypothetical protein [Candidatus Obscuribacterales bacterium]
MFHSDAEHIVRKALEETGATFTEEQIQAICLLVTKICTRTVEEAFANWSPKGGGRY